MIETGRGAHLFSLFQSGFKGKRIRAFEKVVRKVVDELDGQLGDKAEVFVRSSVKHLMEIGAGIGEAEEIARRMSIAWLPEEEALPVVDPVPIEFLPELQVKEEEPQVDKEVLRAEIALIKCELKQLEEDSKEPQRLGAKIQCRRREIRRYQKEIEDLEKRQRVASLTAKNARIRLKELSARLIEIEQVLGR